jgi:WD40 repeat protein
VRLWDLETGKLLCCYRGHKGNVLSVAFSVDGCRAVSGGADGDVRLRTLPPD